jgi:hypothetical protein
MPKLLTIPSQQFFHSINSCLGGYTLNLILIGLLCSYKMSEQFLLLNYIRTHDSLYFLFIIVD